MISTKSGALSEAALAAHEAFVRKLARRLVRDEHQADDLVQETWLAALRQPDAVRGSLRAWARVMGNLARRASLACAAPTARGLGRARQAEPLDRRRRCASQRPHRDRARAVLTLAEPYRSAVVIRYYDDSAQARSPRLGVPVEDRAHAPQTRARDPAPACWSAAALARRCGLGRCWLRARAALRDRVAALATRARSSPFASKAALALLLPLLWIAWVPGRRARARTRLRVRRRACAWKPWPRMRAPRGSCRSASRCRRPKSSTTATAAALRELTGRTWDENGRPLAVSSCAGGAARARRRARRRGYSDAAGRYELRGLPRRSSSMRSTRHGMRSDAGGTRGSQPAPSTTSISISPCRARSQARCSTPAVVRCPARRS